jgi:hypothetical protein
MPRNMSFMLTKQQVYDKTKTHTIRDGWWFLKSGELLNAVEKGMGLKKGEKVTRMCQIRILSTRPDILKNVTHEICIKEGFPWLAPFEFVEMFCKFNKKATVTKKLNFIEFEYI